MPTQFSVGDLRAHINSAALTWQVNPALLNSSLVPLHSLGGDTTNLHPYSSVPALDFRTALVPSANNFLVARRQQLGLLNTPPVILRQPLAGPLLAAAAPAAAPGSVSAGVPGAGAAPATLVDWRNRFGWPWITSVQDQTVCESCWAFCATAVVESMARIEHFAWSKRSEGDVHDGMGAKCANGGDPAAALNWITTNGICDPACYPWSTNDPVYAPTSDRSGRTVKIPQHTELGSISDQKQWLDAVGPIGATFSVYHDFDGYSSGVYTKGPTTTDNYFRGTHCVCIVGYDDNQQAWLMKNSWGTGWGMSGYCWIGYGQSDIDTWTKLGVQGTNTDPWTKRRLHNGAMIESGDGAAHNNFELLAPASGNQIRHYWRDGVSLVWSSAELIGATDAAASPTLTGTTYNRAFECVYLTTGNRLHHYFFDQASGKWNDGGVFGPPDAAGQPGFIQSNYGAPGNFEVVVRTADGRLNHWWRLDAAPWTWNDGGRFAEGIALSGPSLIQSTYGKQGNLELVAVLNGGQMQHWWRDDDAGGVWNMGPTFGAGVSTPPCMIEGEYGAADENGNGNFELCVATNGQIQHWWRNNQAGGQWLPGPVFGSTINSVVALLEGSYGYDLEVIALRTDGQLQHFWRDGAGWHDGPIIGPA